MERFWTALAENFGPLLISVVGLALAYAAIRAFRHLEQARLRLEEKQLEFEQQRFEEEKAFRQEQYERFRDEPAPELAKRIAELLRQNPDWARQALEAANLASYTHTIFGERSHHFSQEKGELAERFAPYLISRCEHLISEDHSVYLLIDAGTTLYPFFKEIGRETARATQQGERWVEHLHLATNNLPGLEQLMKWGRRVSHERYSPLAIEDCHLLPGIPLPVFAAVAGKETTRAIKELRRQAQEAGEEKRKPVFIALVVGNWVRIRQTQPRCPVPMARGAEHCEVKNSLIANADEVFVVSPLGKNFVGQSKEQVNQALGFSAHATRPAKEPYVEVEVGQGDTKRIKLVSTFRDEGALLYRHSVRLEEALQEYGVSGRRDHIGADDFAEMPIAEIPHLLFEFKALPEGLAKQREVEFPHYETRRRPDFLRMFEVGT